MHAQGERESKHEAHFENFSTFPIFSIEKISLQSISALVYNQKTSQEGLKRFNGCIHNYIAGATLLF
jgi:hypothetical protein